MLANVVDPAAEKELDSRAIQPPSQPFFNNTSWWFQPIWKILVKLEHFPK